MSSTAFMQQVTQLLAEMTRCYEFCDAIRANRRLGSTHEALDDLQSRIKQSAYKIQHEYGILWRVFGSRIELGDETARNALNRAIRTVQSNLEPRLSDIAYRRRDSHDPENLGFRKLGEKMTKIEMDVLEELENLATRFENITKSKVPKPTTPKQPVKPKLKTDEVIVSLKELDILMQHMKSSWVETLVAGKILYVNAFDDKKIQWEKPDGFIKALPRVPKPTTSRPTWEQPPRRPARDDHWSNANGW
jgi:hypothetical protein